MNTRLLSLNVRNGGGTNLPPITSRIASHAPDIVILSEVRGRTVPGWRRAMMDCGMRHAYWVEPPPTQPEALLVAGREPLEPARDNPPYPCRSHTYFVPSAGLTLLCSHLWTGKTTRAPVGKEVMWQWLRRRTDEIGHRWVLIGDLNTGDSRDRHPGWKKTFVGEEHFEHLTRRSGVDLWRWHHADLTEWSWIHTKLVKSGRADGFRIDHAVSSRDLIPECVSCNYDHRFREYDHAEARYTMSDHSAIIVDFVTARAAPD